MNSAFISRYDFHVCYIYALHVENLSNETSRHQCRSTCCLRRFGLCCSVRCSFRFRRQFRFPCNIHCYSSPRLSGFVSAGLLHGEMETKYVLKMFLFKEKLTLINYRLSWFTWLDFGIFKRIYLVCWNDFQAGPSNVSAPNHWIAWRFKKFFKIITLYFRE